MKKLARVSGLVIAIGALTYLGFEWDKRNVSDNDKETVQELQQIESEKKKIEDPTPSANLANSVEKFINNWIEENGETLKPLILDNFDSLTGSYIYAGQVLSIEDHIVINTDLSDIMVQKSQVNSYKDLSQVVDKLDVGDIGVSIVKYKNGDLVSLDFHKVSTGTFAQIQMAILGADIVTAGDTNETKDENEKEDYSKTTPEVWKGMALLTAREALNKELAPIFIVPNSSLLLERDLNESFFYIIAGNFVSTNEQKTVLSTYEGKHISLDFGVNPEKLELSKDTPTWVYVLVNDGKIESVELQQFNGGTFKNMSEGIRAYITTSAIDK